MQSIRSNLRRLVVFSDPGGAKPCLSLSEVWKRTGPTLVCSDRKFAFFSNFEIDVQLCKRQDAERILNKFAPELLYTGTSYTSEIELEFIKEAKKRGIYTATFLDHYTSYQKRFEQAGTLILPDEINVTDDRAYQIAMKTALSTTRITITGNPYYAFLTKWKTSLTKAEVFRELNIPLTDQKVILFAPDPLSNAGGKARFGTDETEIMQILFDAAERTKRNFQLIVKFHPNQPIEALNQILSTAPTNIQLFRVSSEKDYLLNDLIQSVDIVGGIFSSILKEADLLGASVFRICANLQSPDPLYGTPGIKTFRTGEDLKEYLCEEINHGTH